MCKNCNLLYAAIRVHLKYQVFGSRTSSHWTLYLYISTRLFSFEARDYDGQELKSVSTFFYRAISE